MHAVGVELLGPLKRPTSAGELGFEEVVFFIGMQGELLLGYQLVL